MTAKQTRPDKEGPRRRGGGWQAEKSAAMRRQVLEAAIRCLVRLGYIRTSTTEIAREAGVSRGAMVHHFENKEQLIKATVAYLNAKRIESFRSSVTPPARDQNVVLDGLELYWRHLTDPAFVAFQELVHAARTDASLAAVVYPAVQRFEAEWYEVARAAFPEWQGKGELFDLAMDLTQFLMEGMAAHTMLDPTPERYAGLRRYLADRLAEILATDKHERETAARRYVRRSNSAADRSATALGREKRTG